MNEKQNSGIDLLRGLAIISVILLHINTRIPFSGTFIGSILPVSVYKIIFWSGYYGVCIFFVISGFLITNSSLDKWGSLPHLRLRGFYSMRFARIAPLLIALLVLLSVLHLARIEGFVISPEKTTLLRSVFAAITFHINWLEIKVGYLPASWDILWSLSIEEVFYLFFPVICIVCRKEWHFIALVAVTLIVSPFARTVWFPGNELADRNHFAYLDAISLGCIAAIVSRRIELNKRFLTLIALTGWSLFVFVIVFRKLVYLLGLTNVGLNVTTLAIGTALILIWMQKRFIAGNLVPSKFTSALRFLGRNSYEVYLTHMFVVLFFVKQFESMRLSGEWIWILYLFVLAISGMLGMLLAKHFSTPLNTYLRDTLMKFKY